MHSKKMADFYVNTDNLSKVTASKSLDKITKENFTPKASYIFDMCSMLVAEICELSCIFCHFNGPKAKKKHNP